jgi:chromatin remodeling complex protein RSC6
MSENVEELIDAIQQQNFKVAKDHFDSILGDKLNDALEQEKISVADSIFNKAGEDEEEFEFDLEDDESEEYEPEEEDEEEV